MKSPRNKRRTIAIAKPRDKEFLNQVFNQVTGYTALFLAVYALIFLINQ